MCTRVYAYAWQRGAAFFDSFTGVAIGSLSNRFEFDKLFDYFRVTSNLYAHIQESFGNSSIHQLIF